MTKVNQKGSRENEKGAAMVMVLLISLLLLTASAGLLMESSMNTQNVSDATAEQQAYNAAESGLQATVNVLRGNVVANPLIDSSKPATDPANRINFRKAVTTTISNEAGDPNTFARLSRWLKYNYSSDSSANRDRITLGSSATGFNQHNGFSYSVSITDPDRTGEILSFNTQAQFQDLDTNEWKSSFSRVSGSESLTITYQTTSKTLLDLTSGSKATDFGKFTVTRGGSGEFIFDETQDIRFQIIINMTAPYTTNKVMRGWIRTGKKDLNTVSSIDFDFDSPVYDIMGSSFTVNNDPLNISFGTTETVSGTVTQPEPFRVLVRSVGYGPRGAKKEIEAIVQKNFFNGLSAPATLTLVGNTTGFEFYAGDSQKVTYSGQNVAGVEIIPSIGTTNQANLDAVISNLEGRASKADIIGYPSNVAVEMPFWLQSPENLDKTLQDLKRVADSSGRLFSSVDPPDTFGNNANATGITYVEGDVTFTGAGGGILVCTGKLTLHGNFNFNGLIIVTGAGGVERTGGGTGILQGNTVVAPYNPADITPTNPNDPPAQFLSPKYNISGGGGSEIIYNSSSIANGMTAVSNFVLGVAEK